MFLKALRILLLYSYLNLIDLKGIDFLRTLKLNRSQKNKNSLWIQIFRKKMSQYRVTSTEGGGQSKTNNLSLRKKSRKNQKIKTSIIF